MIDELANSLINVLIFFSIDDINLSSLVQSQQKDNLEIKLRNK